MTLHCLAMLNFYARHSVCLDNLPCKTSQVDCFWPAELWQYFSFVRLHFVPVEESSNLLNISWKLNER